MEGKCENVSIQVDNHLKKLVEQNRQRLVPIVETIILCGRQNIPLRGHRDDGKIISNSRAASETEGEGNFRALLRYRVSGGDAVLKEHLETAPKNATLISKTTQNDLIDCCGELILQKIVDRVKSGRYFTIIADETTDESTCEQLTLCIRYLDMQSYTVREDFIGFVNVNNLTGEGLTNTILTMLSNIGLSLQDLRGQAYDGGSNMAAKYRGVQARILTLQPLAMYSHCANHCLNLAISKACNVQEIRNIFGTIKEVCKFTRQSAKRITLLEAKIQKHFPESKVKRLKPLCETRWVERHDSVLIFHDMLPAIIDFLEEIVEEQEGTIRTLCNGMLSAITQFQFIVTLEVVVEIFSLTLPLSRQLQCTSLDLINANKMALHTIDTMKNHRTAVEERFEEIYSRAVSLSEKLDICVSVPRRANSQIHRDRANPSFSDPIMYYRTAVYIPFLDHMVSELTVRFSKEQEEVFVLQSLIPAYCSKSAVDVARVLKAAEKYEGDLPGTVTELRGEIDLWQSYWGTRSDIDKPKTAADGLSFTGNGCYPNIQHLLQIIAILPVTTCSAERSFSSLRRVKTYLRSTMTEERLNGLTLLHIHQDIDITPREIIDVFAQKHHRRLQLLCM